jgi:hypothetical protein
VIQDTVTDTLGDPEYLIEVGIRGDTEAFRTPDDFKANVTPEALRYFEWLGIGANNTTLDVQFILRRRQESAAYDLQLGECRGHRLNGQWRFHNVPAEFAVEATTDDPERIKAVFDPVCAAVARGVPSWSRTILVYTLIPVLIGVGFASGLYLIESRWKWIIGVSYLPFIVLIALYVVGSILLRLSDVAIIPDVEIAEPGQSRLWRIMRIAGTVSGGLAVAALAKLFFGG